MEYNSQRPFLMMREHGRMLQNMVHHVQTLPDKAKRTQMAAFIVEVMVQLNPQLKSIEDFRHKLWDQVHFIADFQLDVDSPYPVPERELLYKKPEPLPYPRHDMVFKHYGKGIERMVATAIAMEDPEKKAAYVRLIGNYMKVVHANWNKEVVMDENIKKDLESLSGGKLILDIEETLEGAAVIHNSFPGRTNRRNGRFGRNNNAGKNNRPGGKPNFRKRR